MTFIAAPALAQSSTGGSNQAIFAAGLSFLHLNEATGTGLGVNVNKPIKTSGNMQTGIFGDFAWHTDSGQHALGFLVGPRFAHTGSSQVTPFFQVGLGVTRLSAGSDECDESISECSSSGFTFAPGGGVDVKLNDKVNLRFQLDIPVIKFEGDTETGVRFLIGISCPIGSK
jgi:opacity protein-like surface antigen